MGVAYEGLRTKLAWQGATFARVQGCKGKSQSVCRTRRAETRSPAGCFGGATSHPEGTVGDTQGDGRNNAVQRMDPTDSRQQRGSDLAGGTTLGDKERQPLTQAGWFAAARLGNQGLRARGREGQAHDRAVSANGGNTQHLARYGEALENERAPMAGFAHMVHIVAGGSLVPGSTSLGHKRKRCGDRPTTWKCHARLANVPHRSCGLDARGASRNGAARSCA